ncbi:cytochrome c oxidase subunit 3 [Derxia gummosa]|uniref:cytochrome-c oxidase n=1 Tax=Derxia gummosa DSM 723 TaxID=1121388 RepID=A0A8B6XBJ9_9BURK|nr:cytochrome c oxidase subunit 3 [Derxia gummosa]
MSATQHASPSAHAAPLPHGGPAPRYFVPAPSKWPLVGSCAMLFVVFGAAMTVNGIGPGPWSLAIGFAILAYMLFGWFGEVIDESERGSYSEHVDMSFRWSMGWFIFSEVMFFSAFFGALLYARVITVPWLADANHQAFLWPGFSSAWPTEGPAGTIDDFQTMGPWPIPTINTLLLLSSGATVTWAHHGLLAGKRGQLTLGLALTVLLGAVFLSFQAYEYHHAYTELNLKLSSGVFGSTFFMLTGFHGFHVTLGVIMLTVMLVRSMRGHFTPRHHFAFEATAWYWHFVDVVWLGLYVLVYWL